MSQKSALWKQKMELSRVNDYKKKWKHLYQINTLEDNSWHDNPKNVIIIPWILLFSEGLSALSVWNTSKFFHFVSKLFLNFVFPFLFSLVLISSLLHSVWNSKYYYPLYNFISSSASVFNSLWLHLINRECLTLLFVVMCPPRFISYHQIQNVAKSRHCIIVIPLLIFLFCVHMMKSAALT